MPPIATGRRVLVADAATDLELLTGYLNAYRILVSDLVVLTNAEDGSPTAARDAINAVKDVPVVATVMRPRPAGPVTGRTRRRSSRPRRDRPTAASPTTCAASTTSTSSTSRGTSPNRDALRDELRGIDGRRLPDRDQGRRDRRRCRDGGRARRRMRLRRQPGAAARGEPDLDAELQALAEAVAGQPVARMTERRRTDPLPLGGDAALLEGPDGSRADARRRLGRAGLRARASRSSRICSHASRTRVELDRSRSSPSRCSATARARRPPAASAAIATSRSSTSRSSCSSAAQPAPASRPSPPKSPIASASPGVTSTDFVRQTMRAFFSPEFMPSIHYSSFEAGSGLRSAEEEQVDPLLHGFLDQTRNVLVGVDAAIERSLAEGWSTVLEGVHLVPGMLAADQGRAGRPVRARDRERGGARGPLLDPRPRLGRAAAARQVPRAALRHPLPSGLHRRAGGKGRSARDRQPATGKERPPR